MDAWMWLATGMSLIGTLGVSYKKAWGQLVWIVSNVIWVICYVELRIWPSVALFSVYLIIASGAYHRWRREERAHHTPVVDDPVSTLLTESESSEHTKGGE